MIAGSVFVLLIGFQLKHFVADYLLQTPWMLKGKGDLRAPGGYAHAGLHALGSAMVMAISATPFATLTVIAAAELVVHYALDFSKAKYAQGVRVDVRPARYWALHGFDQLLHQLTYVAMIFVAVAAPF